MNTYTFRDRMGGHEITFEARVYEEAFQEARDFFCSPVLVEANGEPVQVGRFMK